MRTYLQLAVLGYLARRWGRRLEQARVAVTVAEVNMEHYRRQWHRLSQSLHVYRTPEEQEAAIREANHR